MRKQDIKLTSKHIIILKSFTDMMGHFPQPRKNCRVCVWGEKTMTVFFDLTHIIDPKNSPYRDLELEPEWADLRVWELVRESSLGHPIYELTEKANIYIA